MASAGYSYKDAELSPIMNSPLLPKDNITELDYDSQRLLDTGTREKVSVITQRYVANHSQTRNTAGSVTASTRGSTIIGDSRKRRHFSYKNQVAFTIFLHLVLISAYIALFGVYSEHYEHRIVIQLNESWIPTIVTTLSQLIGTVCETVR